MQMNPKQTNWRSAVKWYFPLRGMRVFSALEARDHKRSWVQILALDFFTLVCSENCIVLEKTKLNYATIERLLDKNVHVRSKNRLCGSLLASRQSNKTDTKLIFHVLIQLVFLHTNQTFSVLSYDLGGCLSLVDVFGPNIVLPRRRILTEYIITCSFLEKITVSLCQWLVTEGIQRKETKKERGRGWLAQI